MTDEYPPAPGQTSRSPGSLPQHNASTNVPNRCTRSPPNSPAGNRGDQSFSHPIQRASRHQRSMLSNHNPDFIPEEEIRSYAKMFGLDEHVVKIAVAGCCGDSDKILANLQKLAPSEDNNPRRHRRQPPPPATCKPKYSMEVLRQIQSFLSNPVDEAIIIEALNHCNGDAHAAAEMLMLNDACAPSNLGSPGDGGWGTGDGLPSSSSDDGGSPDRPPAASAAPIVTAIPCGIPQGAEVNRHVRNHQQDNKQPSGMDILVKKFPNHTLISVVNAVNTCGGQLDEAEKLLKGIPEKKKPTKTFGNSEFHQVHRDPASRPTTLHQLLEAVYNVVLSYAEHHGIPPEDADTFVRTVQANALSSGGREEMQELHQLKFIAIRLWTSATPFGGKELSSILNETIRNDARPSIEHAMMVVHAINEFCVTRDKPAVTVRWPMDNTVYRGGAIPQCFQSFFQPGVKYRGPMYISASLQMTTAEFFMRRCPPPTAGQQPPFQEPVLWVLHFDATLPQNERCVHVNFIDRTDGTLGRKEDEMLFAPYSVFTVRNIVWENNPLVNGYTMRPHTIELDVAPDNAKEPNDLPLAPWC